MRISSRTCWRARDQRGGLRRKVAAVVRSISVGCAVGSGAVGQARIQRVERGAGFDACIMVYVNHRCTSSRGSVAFILSPARWTVMLRARLQLRSHILHAITPRCVMPCAWRRIRLTSIRYASTAASATSAPRTPMSPLVAASSATTYLPTPSSRDRWNRVRTVTASLTAERHAPPATTPEWLHLPSMRDAPASHANLPLGDAAAEIDAEDETMAVYRASRQALPETFHSHPVLLTPTVKTAWKKLAAWDRRQQIEMATRERAAGMTDGSSSATGSPRLSATTRFDSKSTAQRAQ